MDVMWSRGSATVGDVTDALGDPPLAYNTVLTTLRILEQKGYVSHEASGRAFIYRPIVERAAAQRSVVAHVVARFFNNSRRDLVLNLLASEEVDESELQRLRELIERRAAER